MNWIDITKQPPEHQEVCIFKLMKTQKIGMVPPYGIGRFLKRGDDHKIVPVNIREDSCQSFPKFAADAVAWKPLNCVE